MPDPSRKYMRREMRLRFDELEKRIELQANEVDRRLSILNDHEAKMKELQVKLVSLDKFDLIIEGIKTDISELKLSRAELKGKADQRSVHYVYVLTIFIGIISILISVVY